MGLFTKNEVTILKESSDAKEYLSKLEELLPKASGEIKEKIEKEITITNAGIIGEDNILYELKNSGMDLVVLHDIYLESKDGLSAQIDFLVITKKITFVIECKNLFGNIQIDNKGNFIRTIEYKGHKRKEGIYSPITQNQRHLNVIQNIILDNNNAILGAIKKSAFKDTLKSLVILANSKTALDDRYATKEVKSKVHRADQLVKVMKDLCSVSNNYSSSHKEMIENGNVWLSRSKTNPKDYLKKYQELVDSLEMKEEASTDEKICPRCGSTLVLRTAKKGVNAGNQFWGCSNFPKCRYIENIK